MVVGRFAPSPTGSLHRGSLVAAAGSWLAARSCGGRWLVRIDDLDYQRCREEYVDDILRTLERFGLVWDGPISRQSEHLEAYQDAFSSLQARGYSYPCGCSRSQIAQIASAPRPGEEIPYPGVCRSGLPAGHTVRGWRLRLDSGEGVFHDLWHGPVTYDLRQLGDPIIKRAEGIFAYLLAVVIDDQLTGVTQVVRGDDLLSVTPRQMYLQTVLGITQPRYGHLPVVTGSRGEKLSKRDNVVSLKQCGESLSPSALLQEALAHLGYVVPMPLCGAPPHELLEWACRYGAMPRLWSVGAAPAESVPAQHSHSPLD